MTIPGQDGVDHDRPRRAVVVDRKTFAIDDVLYAITSTLFIKVDIYL